MQDFHSLVFPKRHVPLSELSELATLGAAYVWYDYTFTAWSDPERNRRFFRIVVGLGIAGSLLLIWLIYKLNSRKIAEKLS